MSVVHGRSKPRCAVVFAGFTPYAYRAATSGSLDLLRRLTCKKPCPAGKGSLISLVARAAGLQFCANRLYTRVVEKEVLTMYFNYLDSPLFTVPNSTDAWLLVTGSIT